MEKQHPMMKAMQLAVKKTLPVHTITPPPPTKDEKKWGCSPNKPSLYLDETELPTAGNYKSGDTIHLTIEGRVKSLSVQDSQDSKGKSQKSTNISIEIQAVADITGSKGK